MSRLYLLNQLEREKHALNTTHRGCSRMSNEPHRARFQDNNNKNDVCETAFTIKAQQHLARSRLKRSSLIEIVMMNNLSFCERS